VISRRRDEAGNLLIAYLVCGSLFGLAPAHRLCQRVTRLVIESLLGRTPYAQGGCLC
jgi:hypothetical protein